MTKTSQIILSLVIVAVATIAFVGIPRIYNIENSDYVTEKDNSSEGVVSPDENKPTTKDVVEEITDELTEEILTFLIEPYKKDCVGIVPMKCMVVNNELFYDTIEGFEFEEGTAYEITVARRKLENVPADASSYAYRLVEILTQQKASPATKATDYNSSRSNRNTGS